MAIIVERQRQKLRQKELAVRIGVHSEWLSKRERGLVTITSPNLAAIASGLGLGIPELLEQARELEASFGTSTATPVVSRRAPVLRSELPVPLGPGAAVPADAWNEPPFIFDLASPYTRAFVATTAMEPDLRRGDTALVLREAARDGEIALVVFKDREPASVFRRVRYTSDERVSLLPECPDCPIETVDRSEIAGAWRVIASGRTIGLDHQTNGAPA